MRKKQLLKSQKDNDSRGIIRYILFAVVGVLVASSVLMTVETATSGMEVASLREKENQLSLERRKLENVYVKSISINDLETKSGELGYMKPGSMVYISQSQEAMAKLP